MLRALLGCRPQARVPLGNYCKVDLCTGPSAKLNTVGVFDADSTDGDTVVSSQIWLESDTVLRACWEVKRH